jgi:outer membrane protein assembly factor BamB
LAAPLAAPAAERLLTEGDLTAIGYRQHWDLDLNFGLGGRAVAAWLLDDNLYVVTDKGDVHAVHAGVGLLRWSQNLTESVHQIFRPTHFVTSAGRSLAVFTSRVRTVILDRYAGDWVADVHVQVSPATAAVADESVIYFGSDDGHFYAMVWNDPRSPKRAVQRWTVMTGGPVTTSPFPANDGEDLVFASQRGMILCCSLYKDLRWQYATGGPILGELFVEGRQTYAASTDRSVYRLDTLTGQLRWRTRLPDPLRTGPVIAGGVVYQYCPDQGIVAIDAESGDVLWNAPGMQMLLARQPARTILFGPESGLTVVDEAGRPQASARLPRGLLPVTNRTDDAVYLVSPSGAVICAKPVNSPALSPADLSVAADNLRRPPGSLPR